MCVCVSHHILIWVHVFWHLIRMFWHVVTSLTSTMFWHLPTSLKSTTLIVAWRRARRCSFCISGVEKLIDQRRADVLCNHDQELPTKEKCLCVCVSHHIHIWVHMFWHLTYVLTRCHVTDINHVLTRCHWNQLRWSWRGGARAAAVVFPDRPSDCSFYQQTNWSRWYWVVKVLALESTNNGASKKLDRLRHKTSCEEWRADNLLSPVA